MTRQRAELKMALRKEWEYDTPEQCRERRRRRIEIRRARWSCSGHYCLPVRDQNNSDYIQETCLLSDYVQQAKRNPRIRRFLHSITNINAEYQEEDETETERVVVVQPAVLVPRYLLHLNPMPEFGTVSIIRRADQINNMDEYDTVFTKEDFCRVEFDHVLGAQPMHFFAVYDGHGHPHVSTLCKEMMHEFVAEELRRVSPTGGGATGDGNLSLASQGEERGQEEAKWPDLVRTALQKSFQRMHRLAQDTCSCGNIGHACGCKPNINALPVAGSTAVVALLTGRRIVIANCGSSRAVLGRAGTPFPLSHDHKPGKLDEQERMRAVDGRISYHNGMRVYGTLNMSHSPAGQGDNVLKPIVTLEPHISIIEREANQDESLILANDGFWDAMPDEMACRVASTVLRDTAPRNVESCVFYPNNTADIDPTGVLLSSKSHLAATILCRLALGRGSHGDMSLLVVDLKSG